MPYFILFSTCFCLRSFLVSSVCPNSSRRTRRKKEKKEEKKNWKKTKIFLDWIATMLNSILWNIFFLLLFPFRTVVWVLFFFFSAMWRNKKRESNAFISAEFLAHFAWNVIYEILFDAAEECEERLKKEIKKMLVYNVWTALFLIFYFFSYKNRIIL